MIYTKEIKIKKVNELSADYIENTLKNMGLDVLRWAITAIDESFYTLDVAISEKNEKNKFD